MPCRILPRVFLKRQSNRAGNRMFDGILLKKSILQEPCTGLPDERKKPPALAETSNFIQYAACCHRSRPLNAQITVPFILLAQRGGLAGGGRGPAVFGTGLARRCRQFFRRGHRLDHVRVFWRLCGGHFRVSADHPARRPHPGLCRDGVDRLDHADPARALAQSVVLGRPAPDHRDVPGRTVYRDRELAQ